MNIFKDPLFWAIAATAGAYAAFGALIATMVGLIDHETGRSITLYIGAPIFIPSVLGLMVSMRFDNNVN